MEDSGLGFPQKSTFQNRLLTKSDKSSTQMDVLERSMRTIWQEDFICVMEFADLTCKSMSKKLVSRDNMALTKYTIYLPIQLGVLCSQKTCEMSLRSIPGNWLSLHKSARQMQNSN